jgi:hypothetical protein
MLLLDNVVGVIRNLKLLTGSSSRVCRSVSPANGREARRGANAAITEFINLPEGTSFLCRQKSSVGLQPAGAKRPTVSQ